jgi:hypothetical protein
LFVSHAAKGVPMSGRSSGSSDGMHEAPKHPSNEKPGERAGRGSAALSEVSNGAKWNPDHSFTVADAILADPEFASVLTTVLRDGHVLVPAPKAKEK